MPPTAYPWQEAREFGDINLVVVSGRIGNDPEIESTYARRMDFCKLRVAVERRVKFRTVEDYVVTNWTSWIAYGRMARHIVEHFRKGQKVIVRGCLRSDQWVMNRGEGGRPRHARRDSLLVSQINWLSDPRPRPGAEEAQPKRAGPALPQTRYRSWQPNPTDWFDTFDPDAEMPEDARLAQE